MERDARLVHTATPRLAKLIQNDYVDKSAASVSKDFQTHHGIKISRHYIQKTSKAVSQIMIEKESTWRYALPKQIDLKQVSSIGLSRDGTTINIRKQGWRETMSGTIVSIRLTGSLTIPVPYLPEVVSSSWVIIHLGG